MSIDSPVRESFGVKFRQHKDLESTVIFKFNSFNYIGIIFIEFELETKSNKTIPS